MTYYVATRYLPRVGEASYKAGELVPEDAPGLNVLRDMGAVAKYEGEPPTRLVPEPTPAAREAAKEEGIGDPKEVAKPARGSGKKGRVTKKDVEEAARGPEEKD